MFPQNPHKRLYLILSIISLIITGFILFNFLNKFEDDKSYKQIIVSSRNISDPKIIEEIDLQFKLVPMLLANENVFYEKEDLIGQNLIKPLAKGTVIYRTDIFSELDPASLAPSISQDRKAFVIDEDWLDSSIEAKVNDYVDIVIAKKNIDFHENAFLIKSAKVVKISQNQNGSKSIVIELSDPEIISLVYARANEFKINLIINPVK